MTDPAAEAAARAYVVRRTRVRAEAVEDLKIARVAEAAAREALKPLRELHYMETRIGQWEWECACGRIWPCPSAEHIYPEDEL